MTRPAAAKPPEGRRRATIDDIARMAGVSKRTVTRVTNQSAQVGAETRARIQAVISDWDYHPDPGARSLALGRSSLIGLVYENPNPQHILNIQQGLLDGLAESGLSLIAHPCRQSSPGFLEDLARFIEGQKLFGVVLPPPLSEDPRIIELLKRIGCRYVRLAAAPLDDPQHMIVGHDRLGARAAGRHILELGHRDIAFISGPANFLSSAERRAGLEAALAERGLTLDPRWALRGAYTFESGLACAEALLAMTPRPTAIFAGNDEMAAGVLRAAQQIGLRIPDDLTVVGFDDFDIASRVSPPLTTVRTPTREASRLAAMKLVMGPEGAGRPWPEVKPELVVRASSGPAPVRR